MLTCSSGKSDTTTVGPDHDSIFKVIIEEKDDKDMSNGALSSKLNVFIVNNFLFYRINT